MKQKISILCPVYNSMEWLPKLILTIPFDLAYEVIFIDDGSMDGSVGYLSEECSKHKNMWVKCNPINKGSSETYNSLLGYACGDYIAMIDSDDYYLLGIRDVLKEVDGTYDIYYYNMEVKNGTTIETDPNAQIYSGNFKVIKREFLGDSRYGSGADGDYVLYKQLLAKNPKEKHTGIFAYWYNFPREHSVNWEFRERLGLDHNDLQ